MNPEQLMQEVNNLNNKGLSEHEIQQRLEAIVAEFNKNGIKASMAQVPIGENTERDIKDFIDTLPFKPTSTQASGDNVSGAITRSDFIHIHDIEFSKTINVRIAKFYDTILKPAFDRYGIEINSPKYHNGHYCITTAFGKMNISIDVNDAVVIFASDVALLTDEDKPMTIRTMFCLVPNFAEYLNRQSLSNILHTVDTIAEDVSGILDNLTQ